MSHACIHVYTFSFTYFEDTKYTETMLYTLHVAGMHDMMHYVHVTIIHTCMRIVVFIDNLIALKNIKNQFYLVYFTHTINVTVHKVHNTCMYIYIYTVYM